MSTETTFTADVAATVDARLARLLVDIAAVDPSRLGHTGPDTPEITAAYTRRNALIWAALALAAD
ncbi:hypothetical protein DLJ47_18195, partial [Micromonospora sp. S4605]|uniref:hypothetical protein n=1 Tax=Micromonospora sp. S4605 TaxID=1420897 RepID=UPI000D966A10